MRTDYRFLGGLLAGFFAVWLLYLIAFYLCLGVPTIGSRWAYEINTKKLALAKETPGPRLLLVGGSASLFGLSAQEIERETGCRTLNLSTHAALGAEYIMHLARQAARPRDTVLLVPEYELYVRGRLDRSWADDLVVDYMISRDPDFYRGLPLRAKLNLFLMVSTKHLAETLKARFHPTTARRNAIYDVANIDAWGDQMNYSITNLPSPRPPITQVNLYLGRRGFPSNASGFAAIESFCGWAVTNHIRVLATFPNLCDEPEYHTAQAHGVIAQICDFYKGLSVPVVGSYEDSLLPQAQFFDTCYHLTSEAAVQRSRRLALKLEPFLKNGTSQP